MTYLSVCSGIEAASVAWHPLAWKPWAFAEVEQFPSAVLEARWPGVPNLGDITQWKDWPDATLDLLVGGTPCQSFSVAGLRKGLDDPRGGLLYSYLAIARRYRPRWLVWENVPGVLSSSGGRDFGALLGGLAELGYGFAYRVLDAQYVRVESHPRAVPQRRRRVFVVGHSGGLWQRAAAVLFERESLCGHPAPRREAGESVAGTVTGGTSAGGHGRAYSVEAAVGNQLVAHALRGEGFDASEDGTGRGTPLVPTLAPTLDVQANAIAGNFATSGGLVPVHAFDARQSDVIQGLAKQLAQQLGKALPELPHARASQPTMQVRRLTPRECERLMGFPDDYTLIPYRGKPAADGPRYKALGNSMAVPCMSWIGRRIQMVEAI